VPVRWCTGVQVYEAAVIGAGQAGLSASYDLRRQSSGGALFRFLSLDGGFIADLHVDGDGPVLDYPGLFRRAWPQAQTRRTLDLYAVP
jgi:hypothetical protein